MYAKRIALILNRRVVAVGVVVAAIAAFAPLTATATASPGCGLTVGEVEANRNRLCAQQHLRNERSDLDVAERQYQSAVEHTETGSVPILEASQRIEVDVGWVQLLEHNLERIPAPHRTALRHL
jgi:hypothetical protein